MEGADPQKNLGAGLVIPAGSIWSAAGEDLELPEKILAKAGWVGGGRSAEAHGDGAFC